MSDSNEGWKTDDDWKKMPDSIARADQHNREIQGPKEDGGNGGSGGNTGGCLSLIAVFTFALACLVVSAWLDYF